MTSEEKKAYMLLKSVIFHYHGLDEEEMIELSRTADELDAHNELAWANNFISEDYFNSFERAREYLNDFMQNVPQAERVGYIEMVWQANELKGFVTEFEAASIIKLAKDWAVDDDLQKFIKAKK